ncbi:ABC transporter ATP-binding protein [Candidatus Poribacteria bacterium]|nr:ABC transporter ATP-binding protein [Candidatus Poribacteria bacterium]
MAIGVLSQGVVLISSYLGQDVGWRATNRMRGDLAFHCLNLDMWFHHEHTPGEMVERVDGDTTALSNFFSEFVLQVIGSTFFLIGVLILVFREDWRIGVALMAFAVIAFLVYNLTRSIAVPIYTAEREGYSKLFGFLEERLTGIEDIRTNGSIAYTMERFYNVNRDVYGRVVKSEVMGEVLRTITAVLFVLGYALAMGMSIYLYRNGAFTIGTVFMVFQYTAMLRQPLDQISRQINDLQKATAGLKRIEELYRTETRIQDGTETLPSPLTPLPPSPQACGEGEGGEAASGEGERRGKGGLSVEFDNVTFSYVEGETVLKEVSFQLSPGRVLGLLGRTGSGKTTITRLLFRFYDVDTGQICIGGTPIEKIRLENLRQHVGMVTQDVQLFNATVRENMTLFNPAITDRQILAIIEELGLSAWYESLKDGLDTMLAAGGGGLSAGEAQLLAFARVFLKNPGIVILDEPSSRLDPATEQQIDRAVQKLLQNRTGIIIAHRLGTVQRVDEIMFLEDGRIREYGEREKLVGDANSRFSQLLKTGLEEEIV